jgi:hypothetical protein
LTVCESNSLRCGHVTTVIDLQTYGPCTQRERRTLCWVRL